MELAIQIKDLKKSYKNTLALDGIDLEIKPGQFYGLLGPNGAGKTTTIGIITGLVKLQEGSVSIFGKDIIKDFRFTRSKIGVSPQDFNSDWFFSIEQLLLFQAGYYGIPSSKAIHIVEKIMKKLGIYEKRKNKIRTLSGGIDPVALYPPKRFFGAARNTEEGGSLTIIAACLVDTGSRMDEVIYEEFKGTGNMEIHLDRKLAESRIYPAFDLPRSGTRREELLFDKDTKQKIDLLRRMVSMITSGSNSMDSNDAIQKIMEYLKNSPNNEKFLASLGQPGK